MLRALLLLMSVITPSGQPKQQQPSDYTPAAAPNVVSWQLKRLPPPSPLYITRDDVLRVTVVCGLGAETVTCNYRLLRAADGVVVAGQFTVRSTAAYSFATINQPMAEGFLLSVSCQAASAVTRGQTFVRMSIANGALGTAQPAYMLMADYVTTRMAPGFPNGRVISSTEGPGWIHRVAVGSPAAGADWSFAVPANARWRLQFVVARLTTSAAVANRVPNLFVNDDTGTRVWSMAASAVIAASINAQFTCQAATPLTPQDTTYTIVVLPPNLTMGPNSVFGTSTTAIQAADQWSLISMDVEEWMDNV
jgi:hypothetical protein